MTYILKLIVMASWKSAQLPAGEKINKLKEISRDKFFWTSHTSVTGLVRKKAMQKADHLGAIPPNKFFLFFSQSCCITLP